MPSTTRTPVGRLGVLIAGAVVLATLTVGSAGASLPAAPMGVQAPEPPRPDTSRSTATRSAANPSATIPLFVLEKDRFTTIVLPFRDAVPQDLVRINNRGQIVGGTRQAVFDDQGFVVGGGHRGFLRDQRGRYTRFDVPGAAGTAPNDLNDRGQIVGTYSNTNSDTGLADDKRGFLRDARGRYRTIHVPGAAQTQAFGINNRSQVVGEYTDTAGRAHGFLWDRGRFTTIDGPDGAGASATKLNDRGQVIGLYLDAGNTIHGFLLSKRVYTPIDAPGAAVTFPFGINNRGQIVGLAQTAPGGGSKNHGFLLAKGVTGPFTPVDVPGALGGTVAGGINGHGQIAGIYGRGDTAPSAQPTS